MKRTASISDFLKPLRDKPYQAYLSNALHIADILDWELQQLVKSEVWPQRAIERALSSP